MKDIEITEHTEHIDYDEMKTQVIRLQNKISEDRMNCIEEIDKCKEEIDKCKKEREMLLYSLSQFQELFEIYKTNDNSCGYHAERIYSLTWNKLKLFLIKVLTIFPF